MLNFGLESLQKLTSDSKLTISPIYVTEPWGIIEQPAFLNMAVQFNTGLAPLPLLRAIKEIERKAGRTTRPVWTERELDIDILLFDNLIIRTNRLSVPHLRMAERRFVLLPLNDIAPNRVIPGIAVTVSEALSVCPDPGWVKPYKDL